jgi:glutamine synthetase
MLRGNLDAIVSVEYSPRKISRRSAGRGGGCMDAKAVLDYAAKHSAKILDLRFIDVPGVWQHVSFPIQELKAESFDEGFGMDASSIRGWAQIHESDMLLIPDPNTAFMDPFRDSPTLVMICDAVDPPTRKAYERDVRHLARRAEAHLQKSGIADQAFFGAEAEFFIFDNVRFDQRENFGFYYIDSDEGRWNSGRAEHNLGYRPRYKEGYFPVPPTDHFQDLRTDMALQMQACGLSIECHHHEVATAGQSEIDFKFETLVRAADNMMIYKYIVRNVAYQYGKTVTFMPKPLFQDNGSGMHTHQSLWNKGKPLFAGDGYAGLSQTALWYIGGLLKHAAAIVAFAAPTTNSYKRLVPGFEAPVNLAYSKRNRSAAVRIPVYSQSPKAKRLEFRPPDASCNPYLAYAAMLMAGLDGVESKTDPGQPLDRDIYELSSEELKHVPSLPGSLEESLRGLEQDHAFLTKGGVFTDEFIRLWIDYKMSKEVNPMRMRPHPYEFQLYYDI